MNQEIVFRYGKSCQLVQLSQDTVRQLKENLKFKPQSQYYLRLPNQDYLFFVLFCFTARSDSLTKKSKQALNKINQGFRKEIEMQYINTNDKRESFVGPYELELFSNTLNYNVVLFQNCHDKFKAGEIQHSLDFFKDKFKVLVFYPQTKEHLGSDKKLENSQQAIYLVKDGKTVIICAYSTIVKLILRESRSSSELPVESEKKLRKQSERTEISKQNQPKLSAKKEKSQKSKSSLKKDIQQEDQQEQQGQSGQSNEKQNKVHQPYTAILVFILIVLLYFGFAQIDPSFYAEMPCFNKSILEHLIEGIDSVTHFLFGSQ